MVPDFKQLMAIVKNDKEASAANGMGCYTVGDATNQLSLLLCENEQSAQTVAKTEGKSTSRPRATTRSFIHTYSSPYTILHN